MRFVKGFVPTPTEIVDVMVAKLFAEHPPSADARVLDPGCGEGEFIAGVLRACRANGWPVPQIVGVELDPARARTARRAFADVPQVTIREKDFLQPSDELFDHIIGNPPYVSILELSAPERLSYRGAYRTARGRFDLYSLFFEQALRQLKADGRLVFITPEKFLYVETTRPLRELLRSVHIEELAFADEGTFAKRVAYPLITTLVRARRTTATRIVRRDGSRSTASLNSSASWMPLVEGYGLSDSEIMLADVSLRISCGVATGADSVYVLPTEDVPRDLRRFAHPTISGRQITTDGQLNRRSSLLSPYDTTGSLLPESKLGALGQYLRSPEHFSRLTARTCTSGKPWYAFHDNLPLPQMLRPKLLCKDITEHPFFVVDEEGSLVPRHSVYYVVPSRTTDLIDLADYLNSEQVTAWLRAHCQRAAGGFLRMQSHVLKRIPLPDTFAASVTHRSEMLALELLPA